MAASRLIRTSPTLSYSVKSRVVNLSPHQEYYYRFTTRGSESPIGRFRTAPASKRDIKFAWSGDTAGCGCFGASSGAAGVKLHRRHYGEQVENVAGSGEYHWMAGNFLKYGGPLNAGDLPVDAHHRLIGDRGDARIHQPLGLRLVGR